MLFFRVQLGLLGGLKFMSLLRFLKHSVKYVNVALSEFLTELPIHGLVAKIWHIHL